MYPSKCRQPQRNFGDHGTVDDDFEDDKKGRTGAALMEGQEYGPNTEGGHDNVEDHVEL